MRYRLVVFILFLSSAAFCQGPYLKPSIGLASLPALNTAICPIPVYLGNYLASGYHLDDTIPDFTFYDVNGNATSMHDLLLAKKPVLLVAGSYTCPEFRYKVPDINAMEQFYAGLLKIVVVYIVEAHPDNAICPYTGNLNITNYNIQDNVLYDQPGSYGARVAMVDTMNAHLNVLPQVLIDGPCNEWWTHFGPAPNNAYLIDTNGIVVGKNGWYNYNTENMWCSIDSLLGTNSGYCNAIPQNGYFSLFMTQDTVVNGAVGDVLTVHGVLRNLSATNDCTIDIKRTIENIPSGWETSLCTDICLPPNVPNTQVILAPLDTQSFTFYFYTDPNLPGNGNAEVTFTNLFNPNNVTTKEYYAHTSTALGTAKINAKEKFNVSPNPAIDHIDVSFTEARKETVILCDMEGRQIRKETCYNCKSIPIDVSALPRGVYWLQAKSELNTEHKKIIVR